VPTLEENKHNWKFYDWSGNGDEWSGGPEGTKRFWKDVLFTKISSFVPCETILEIAPGLGRWTQFLKDLCKYLIVVDLTEVCIEGCKKRFSTSNNISYYVNDGKSLEVVKDNSVDFVFSYDSLIHVDCEIIECYVSEIYKKLKMGGFGLIHHSNVGSYSRDFFKKNKKLISSQEMGGHWRDTYSSKEFAACCVKNRLLYIKGEKVGPAPDGCPIDCLSLFQKIKMRIDFAKSPNKSWSLPQTNKRSRTS
jgi:hypothetical protein